MNLLFSSLLFSGPARAEPVSDVLEVHQGHSNIEWLDSFTYVLLPEDGLQIGDTRVDGALTWMYTGPNPYSTLGESPQMEYDTVYRMAEPQSFAEWITALTQVDGQGQTWRVVDFDVDAIPPDMIEQFYSNRDVDTGEDEVEHWEAYGWTTGTCFGIRTDIWDDESRTAYTNLNSGGYQRRVLFWLTGVSRCSGVLVSGPVPGRNYMVTAAHCAMPTPGGTVGGVSWICSRGNHYSGADCVQTPPGGFTVTTSSGWAGGNSSPKNDFAVVTWTTATGKDATFDKKLLEGVPSTGMTISSMSNSAIEADRILNLGHPSSTSPSVNPLTCSATASGNNVEANSPTETWSPLPNIARPLIFEQRTDHNATNNYIRTKMDGTGGASGGAIISCPGGSCSGGAEELVGLFVGGWTIGTQFRTGGPKWSRFSPLVSAL